MTILNFGRRQQIWLAVILFFIIFAATLWFLDDMTTSLFWRVMVVTASCVVLVIGIFDFWLRRDIARRESGFQLLDRIAAGDLSLSGQEILLATHSRRMSAALRALVLNLERTIRRFGQLATDVSRVTDQMSGRSRVLARSAAEQLQSTESTSTSVTQIDESINAVRKSMQGLSGNAEDTSTSVLQMSASIEEVSRIADQLAEFVEQTASAFEEMSASINEVATNTEGFSSFATETASTIIEMHATATEIGRSAKQSSELARYVRDAATEGRSAVEGTVDGMRKIEQAVEEAKRALADLTDRSQEIGDIIRVIDEIAGQTNLLALNAAIIAAQAGERGKGFAVVADEIRDLSERTSASTEEIRTLIQNVQRGVNRAGDQMTISAERVGNGVMLTARAAQVLEKILDLTDRSTNSISEIAKATEEQARGSQAATQAIEEVTKMVQQTATATQQQSQTARKVGEQAAMVRDYTKHLKRAMTEQESGSRAISTAMQNISGLVQNVLEATSVLAAESATIVKAMSIIQQGSRESSFGVSDLNQMAGALSHESTLLTQELARFSLPTPRQGGKIVTATVLWQKVTFDPIHTSAAALFYMSKAVHAKLVSYGEGAELRPELAERWEVLEQGLLYRLYLRRDVRFHNGRRFQARDVADSLVRLLLPENKSHASWIMRTVRGAEDVISGKTRTLSGLVVRDAHTIDIHLEEPVAFFMALLSMAECSIIPAEDARDAERFRLRAPGAGPFCIDEIVEGKSVRLRRNDEYFITGQPLIDELVFRLDLRSTRDVADAFLRGELDIAHGIPLHMVRQFQNDVRFAPYLLKTIQLHTSYFGYDSSTAPFDRVEVRQAVTAAINRQRLNDQIFGGLGEIANGLLPPGLLGYERRMRADQHDPERARALLREAGYPNGFTVTYRTWETDEFRNLGMLKLVIEDLAAVGIQVNVSEHPTAEARLPLLKPGHGNVFFGNWYADFPDPDNFFFIFFHSHSNAVPGLNYHSPELDREIERARLSNDVEERATIYRRLDEQVVREAPIVPLFHERLFVMHKPEIRGVRTWLVPPPVRYHDLWLENEPA
jgi:methyl-accepting chemotaxis protein/ABC-type transport system substrate-binding protein